MASTAQPEISSELEKKEVTGEEADNNPEEPMDEEDDENDDGADDGDVEEDVVVQIGATYSCRRQDGTYHDAEIMKTRKSKQAGREEEYFVHYVGLNRRQNEWVDKTQLVIPKPVKEGQETNNTDPETTEDGKAAQKRKNEDDASDAKKVKVDVKNTPTNSAAASGDFAEELTCLLCSELFKDPVMVECGHNFCRNCIDKAWNGQESFTCPDCKEVITDKRYTTNRALANLVKKTVGSTPTLTPVKSTEKPKLAENCPEHDERLKLYCKDDGILSCVICRDSLKHASHTFLPILDAVGVYRTELSSIVAPLEEALKVTELLTDQQSENVEKHKANVSEFRQHIVSEFEKLNSFLKERQEKLLEQLQEQGETLLKEMEENQVKMQDNQDDIKQTITMANERMNDTDSISFLTGIKSFIEKCQEQQKDVMVAGNTLLSKDLCQGTFKGPIQYSVWKQMQSFIVPLESCQEPSPSGEPEMLLLPSPTVDFASEQPTVPVKNLVSAAAWNRHGKVNLSLNIMKQLELQDKVIDISKMQEEKITEHKAQKQQLSEYITNEFQKMHKFLNDAEREQRLKLDTIYDPILKEMEENRKKLIKDLKNLEKNLEECQKKMADGHIGILQDIRQFMQRQCETEQIEENLSVVNEKPQRGLFKGPYEYYAWRRMLSVVQPATSPLTLDPETAHRNLLVSEDLTSISYKSSFFRRVPDSPKRFSHFQVVLTREGFSDGHHYWEVGVDGKNQWTVGLARGTIDRKQTSHIFVLDDYWAVSYEFPYGLYLVTEPIELLGIKISLKRVGVYLDYEAGQVSFYDAEKMTHLYTYTATFSEKLYPYIGTASTEEAPVKIVHVQL
ncbi:nuclear factor 7, brain-like isoform X3 [Hyla sarda]|uniref:nuclear factor 7, brain-like isoform X3 n=1 Tax=Hyla sarda TaxID=327740 RepID=UPI0024C39653|nr:nuclear factor 7, brain-like isoform X3 [Hyla sarda]